MYFLKIWIIMKKINALTYTLLLSLIMHPQCNALSEPEQKVLNVLGGTGIICICTLIGVCWKDSNAKHTELEKERMRLEAQLQEKEREQEKQKKQFHIIDTIKKLSDAFKELREKNPRIETHQGKVHEEILKKIRLLEGSATNFEKKVTYLTQACNELEPEIAQEHQEALNMLSWIRQSMHANPLVNKQKNIEWEARLQAEKKEAEARTITLGAEITDTCKRTAQHHLAASQRTEKLVTTAKNTINKNQQDIQNQISQLQNQHHQILNLLTSILFEDKSQHSKIHDNIETLKKNLEEKNKNIDEQLGYIGRELADIKRSQLPQPTAPPAQTFPATQNPPAQNPDYIPGIPPYAPQR